MAGTDGQIEHAFTGQTVCIGVNAGPEVKFDDVRAVTFDSSHQVLAVWDCGWISRQPQTFCVSDGFEELVMLFVREGVGPYRLFQDRLKGLVKAFADLRKVTCGDGIEMLSD